MSDSSRFVGDIDIIGESLDYMIDALEEIPNGKAKQTIRYAAMGPLTKSARISNF